MPPLCDPYLKSKGIITTKHSEATDIPNTKDAGILIAPFGMKNERIKRMPALINRAWRSKSPENKYFAATID
jgi:hypothetical protein